MHRSRTVVCTLVLALSTILASAAVGALPDPVEIQGEAVVQSIDIIPLSCTAGTNVTVTAVIRVTGTDWLIDAEYFVVPIGESPGADGTGRPMTTDDAAQQKTKTYNASFTPADLGMLPGKYDVYVHGLSFSTQGGVSQTWGDLEMVTMEVLHDGPTVIDGPTVTPAPITISGSNMTLTATISDVGTGDSVIISAEYFVDVVDLSENGNDMTFQNGGSDEVTEVVFSDISVADFVSDHGSGVHILYVHGKDISGAWGPFGEVTINIIDDVGPVIDSLAVSPNPTDGADQVTVSCVADDRDTGGSAIARGEYFIYPSPGPGGDPTDVPGTGTPFWPSDGNFNQDNEDLEDLLDLTGYGLGDYIIYAHAMDAAGNWGPYSQTIMTINDNQPPVFAGIQGVGNVGDGTSLTLWWDAASDPSVPITYNIYISPGVPGNEVFTTPSATTDGTTYTYPGLTQGQWYYFVVRAQDSEGNEDTNVVELGGMPTVDSTPPTFAGVGSVTDTGAGGELEIAWSAASDPSGPITYNVYMGPAPGAVDTASPVASTQDLSATVGGLTNGVTYYFIVRAMDFPGNEDTNTVEMSGIPTFIDTEPPAFDGIRDVSDANTGNALVLSWNGTTDPSLPITYNIYLSAPNTPSFNFGTPSATTQNLEYTYTGLTNGVTYYFVVRAQDAQGNEDGNTVIKGTMVLQPDNTPPAFNGLESVELTSGGTEAILKWTLATDDNPPIQYNVYYAETSGGQDLSSPDAVAYGNSTVISYLDPTKVYFFVVRAQDSRGNEDTNTVEISPGDGSPPAFGGLTGAVDLQTGGQVALSWDPATDPSMPIRYLVFVAPASDNFDLNDPVINTSNPNGATVDGLENGRQYRFLARAQDSLWNTDTNSVILTVIPTDITAPTVGDITVESTDRSDELYVSWTDATDNSGIAYYLVYVSTDSATVTESPPAVNTTQTSATVTGLRSGTGYTVRVVAYDNEGNSDYMESTGTTSSDPLSLPPLPWWVIALIVLGLILLIAVILVIIFVVYRVGKKKGEEQQRSFEDMREVNTDEGGTDIRPEDNPELSEDEYTSPDTDVRL